MTSPDKQPSKKSAVIEPLRPARPCPMCQQASVRKYYPFCSKRCADLDLNRWLTGAYAIPVVEEDRGLGTDLQDD